MLVELGNDNPRSDAAGPAVTTINVPEGGYTPADVGMTQEIAAGQEVELTTAEDLATEVMRQVAAGGGVTHLPGQEAVLSVVACWNAEGAGRPTWVAASDADFQKLLAQFFGCPEGKPADVEMTHFTVNGPPGVGPVAGSSNGEVTA